MTERQLNLFEPAAPSRSRAAEELVDRLITSETARLGRRPSFIEALAAFGEHHRASLCR
jgi:hypothetical protein